MDWRVIVFLGIRQNLTHYRSLTDGRFPGLLTVTTALLPPPLANCRLPVMRKSPAYFCYPEQSHCAFTVHATPRLQPDAAPFSVTVESQPPPILIIGTPGSNLSRDRLTDLNLTRTGL